MPWLRKERSPKRRNRSTDHGTEAAAEVQFKVHIRNNQREQRIASDQ